MYFVADTARAEDTAVMVSLKGAGICGIFLLVSQPLRRESDRGKIVGICASWSGKGTRPL